MKVPIVSRSEYIIYLENFSDRLWLHTDVFKWTPTVYREFVYHLDVIEFLIKQPIYAFVEDSNPKLKKFLSIVGFKFDEKCETNEGEPADIYIRSK